MLATTIHKSNTTPHHQNLGRQPNPPRQSEAVTPPVSPKRDEEMTGLLSQSPIVCLAIIFDRRPKAPEPISCSLCTRSAPLQRLTPSRLGYGPMPQPFS